MAIRLARHRYAVFGFLWGACRLQATSALVQRLHTLRRRRLKRSAFLAGGSDQVAIWVLFFLKDSVGVMGNQKTKRRAKPNFAASSEFGDKPMSSVNTLSFGGQKRKRPTRVQSLFYQSHWAFGFEKGVSSNSGPV